MTSGPSPPRLAFGLNAGPRPWLAELGVALEELGYDELWSNHVRAASGLETLAAVARATRRLRLAVGVVPLSESAPRDVASLVLASGLSPDRLTVGVGSGSERSLDAVRDGVAELRGLLPGFAIGLAAVGPRMAALGGEVADVVLLNWIGPRLAAERRGVVLAAARAVRRDAPRVAAYVRVAVGPGAEARLTTAQARYAGRGDSYRLVIREQESRGEAPVGIAGTDPGGVADALAGYWSGLDTVVVRGLPADDALESWLAVARAAAPAARGARPAV